MAKISIGDDSPEETPETIKVILNGTTETVEASAEKSILDALMDEGLNPPYSCMEGNCMACMAKIKEGRITQDDPGILTDDNISENEILTCQAKPVTKTILVDFDDI